VFVLKTTKFDKCKRSLTCQQPSDRSQISLCPVIQTENNLPSSALSVVISHDLTGLIYQATIAILLLVGFESATAMAREAINPRRDIPRSVILSFNVMVEGTAQDLDRARSLLQESTV